MSDIIIKAENLGKKYLIGHQTERGRYTALRDVLMQNARSLWNKTKDLAQGKPIIQGDTMEEVWALKDVSFEIKRGEAVGIIGRNGAGKSTLLKILSRITEPSTGRVTIKGRVASLLEVGTGFHPELSGRENIYLNGTILGMTRAEIKRKFDEIVAFAEVEKYLDTPVKRYSSGMYVRLAFAVAAHLEPEILVVDEVLAVGDAQFQKKCLGKMGDVSKEGRTILFVSHNMAAILSLCNRGILLNAGYIQTDDLVAKVTTAYMNAASDSGSERVWETIDEAPGDEIVRLKAVRAISDGKCKYNFNIDEDVFVEVEFWSKRSDVPISVSLHLIDKMGIEVLATGSESRVYSVGLHKAICRFPADFFNDGRYSINAILVTQVTNINAFMREIITFNVVESEHSRGEYLGHMLGVIRPKLAWHTMQLM
jgi:lipopolysaccharide transport system ATP-binding protein